MELQKKLGNNIIKKMLWAVFRSQGLKDPTPSALVHCPLWKWKPVANCACHSEGMHQMVKSCCMAADQPIKAHCFCLFRLQREYWSVWKTTQANAANCQRVLGSDLSVYFPNVSKKIPPKPVHVDKQSGGKVPDLFWKFHLSRLEDGIIHFLKSKWAWATAVGITGIWRIKSHLAIKK